MCRTLCASWRAVMHAVSLLCAPYRMRGRRSRVCCCHCSSLVISPPQCGMVVASGGLSHRLSFPLWILSTLLLCCIACRSGLPGCSRVLPFTVRPLRPHDLVGVSCHVSSRPRAWTPSCIPPFTPSVSSRRWALDLQFHVHDGSASGYVACAVLLAHPAVAAAWLWPCATLHVQAVAAVQLWPGLAWPFSQVNVCHWTLGFRFGEALHPGPVCDSMLTCVIANPTAIHRKEVEIRELDADAVCLAETSADASVQNTFSRTMAVHGYRAFFGQAVPPLWDDTPEGATVRGAAGGVAIVTRLPSRLSPSQLPTAIAASTRLVEAFVRFGALELRLLTLYGVPASHANARESNDFLLSAAWDRLTMNAIPTLFAGDFNCDVTTLPMWAHFCGKGYLTAQAAAAQLLNITLGPTCRDVTSFDTFLLPPVLLGYLRHAEVLREPAYFDSHSPLRLSFAMPGTQALVRRWCMPKSWLEFDVCPQALEAAYDQQADRVTQAVASAASQAAVDHAFTVWASAVETAVDTALQCMHRRDPVASPQPRLPRTHKGRCRPPRFLQRQGPQLPRSGRHGDFMPPVECTSVRLRMRVCQCRRVRTFLSGLRKLEGMACPSDVLLQQLFQEWEAILRAKVWSQLCRVGHVLGVCFGLSH